MFFNPSSSFICSEYCYLIALKTVLKTIFNKKTTFYVSTGFISKFALTLIEIDLIWIKNQQENGCRLGNKSIHYCQSRS